MAEVGLPNYYDSDEEQEDKKFLGGKPVCLSLQLIVKRLLQEDTKEWPQDKIIKELSKIKRVRLDRENIGEIDNLELLSDAVTNLYLQSNKITRIQNLECLPNLQVLILSNNEIKKVEEILHLQKLVFLDISDNHIDTVTGDEFPKSIIILNLKGNPCVDMISHRTNMIKALPKLRQLDEVNISSKEKIQAGIDCELSDDDENNEEDDEEKGGDDSVLVTSNKVLTGDLQGKAYRQLPKIQTRIQDVATEMLVRSQKRMEDRAREHRRHIQEMTNIRIKTKIKPNPELSRPE